MTDHAALLRQMDKDSEPYIEQWLDLAEVFAGFRKLASDNGMDWGQAKALFKAKAQDRRAGSGSKRVDRIIDKAEFASAYADMLGLGTSNMNEDNFSASEASYADEGIGESDTLPPHDEVTGELTEPETAKPVTVGEGSSSAAGHQGDASPIPIEEVPANGPATAPAPGAGGEPAKGDAGEKTQNRSAVVPSAVPDASPISCEECQDTGVLDLGDGSIVCPCREFSNAPQSPDPAHLSDDLDIPARFKRGDPECVVRTA